MDDEAENISPPSTENQRRRICERGCERPMPVCICHAIPKPPIPTTTRVLIVQHPHEAHHRLNTTSLLSKSLVDASTVVTRRLRPEHMKTYIYPPIPTYYLFPYSPSTPLSCLNNKIKEQLKMGPVVLIAFDGTWNQAREMVRASEEYLSNFATRVCLDGYDPQSEGGSIYNSDLLLRKEPRRGCVSTAEAVARWLGAVENNGPDIEIGILGALREMVRLQAQYLKPVPKRGRKTT